MKVTIQTLHHFTIGLWLGQNDAFQIANALSNNNIKTQVDLANGLSLVFKHIKNHDPILEVSNSTRVIFNGFYDRDKLAKDLGV